MTASIPPPDSRPAWRALAEHRARAAGLTLRELFRADPERGRRLALEAAGVYLDYSKNRVTDETLRLLVALAERSGLRERIDAMFRGERINATERRPALHVALRAPRAASIVVDGRNVVPDVRAELDRMCAFAERVRRSEWKGHSGRPIRSVVNLGIGGSDLGPAMACEALRRYADRTLAIRFVSNADGTDFAEATRDLDPAETLFIVASKTFATPETMANAELARAWVTQACRGDPRAAERHFVAVTANAAAAAAQGFEPERRFALPEWVGGRFSLGSAIGLATTIAIGPEAFRALLAGMREMDEHFHDAPFDRNLPVLHALLWIWNSGFLGAHSVAVLPYEQYLRRLPAYLQQLAMESNGKRVTEDGAPVGADTGPIVWGDAGTNGQHSFFQLLHQGTRIVPCEFIACARASNPPARQHDFLIANCFAQAEALAFGRTAEEARAEGTPPALIPHRVCEGNRPSSLILLDELTPAALGRLVALYEHSVFAQGALWRVDPFDQWGVELGKGLAQRIAAELAGAAEPAPAHDSSTAALIRRYRERRDA